MKEKQRIEKSAKRLKILCFLFILAIVAAACVVAATLFPPKTWKYYVALPNVSAAESGELRVSFLSVGQGDATLVRFPDGKVMLVDGGDESKESELTIMRYLNAAKIDKIDYLVLTHANADHCGALDVVANYKEIGIAYLPTVLSWTPNESYQSFVNVLAEKGCPTATANRLMKIESTNPAYPYSVHCVFPYASGIDRDELPATGTVDENAASCVLLLSYQGTEVLLTGDAPSETESAIIRDDSLGLLNTGTADLSSVEILKVAHHGSKTSTSETFLEYIGVETAVISVGKGNGYGHPETETLYRLTACGATVYRTDVHGHIVAVIGATGEYRIETE